jgi:hypothetical protein
VSFSIERLSRIRLTESRNSGHAIRAVTVNVNNKLTTNRQSMTGLPSRAHKLRKKPIGDTHVNVARNISNKMSRQLISADSVLEAIELHPLTVESLQPEVFLAIVPRALTQGHIVVESPYLLNGQPQSSSKHSGLFTQDKRQRTHKGGGGDVWLPAIALRGIPQAGDRLILQRSLYSGNVDN